MVDFAGWEMPVQYQSILEEHLAVRRGVGFFDVSHMGVFEFAGEEAEEALDFIFTNRVCGVAVGHGVYSPACDGNGFVVDDCIIYRMEPNRFLVVVNAANRLKDFSFFGALASLFKVSLSDLSNRGALLAVQGPEAVNLLTSMLGPELAEVRRFGWLKLPYRTNEAIAFRTGYTGEDGFEILLRAEDGPSLAEDLLAAGATPCGLGARDSLRLEAGYPLYGHEFDSTRTPFEGGVGWAVKMNKDGFSGQESLSKARANGALDKLVHFITADKRQARGGAILYSGGNVVGKVASGAYSPILERGIGSAHLRAGVPLDGTFEAEVRGNRLQLQLAKPPLNQKAPAVQL